MLLFPGVIFVMPNFGCVEFAGGLVKLEKDGTVCNWQLLFPVATTIAGCSFSGFVTKLDIKTPMDGAMTADLTIKISGAVTWA